MGIETVFGWVVGVDQIKPLDVMARDVIPAVADRSTAQRVGRINHLEGAMTIDLPTAGPRPMQALQPSNAGHETSGQPRASRRPATPATTAAWRLSPRMRKALVAGHVLVGVGW